MPAVPKKPPQRKKSRKFRALLALSVVCGSGLGLWFAIHEVPWLGPTLADGGRALLGPEAIAWAEDVSYGIADDVNLWLHGEDAPTTFWEPPAEASVVAEPPPPVEAVEIPTHFPPPAFVPPQTKVAAEGDGHWVAIVDARHPERRPALYKSVVHPDPRRPFAAIAVVAIDLVATRLNILPGTHEPESNRVRREDRSGLIPKDDYAQVLAAFNGGFKAIHGHYGMRIGSTEYVAPRDIACTLGLYRDGRIAIDTWSTMKADNDALAAYRQTPPCLVEEGKTHAGLEMEMNRNWGAAVDGETIIRRSAVGINKAQNVLFYGLGEAVTAQSMGRGMLAVGADTVAELDINYSYPRFLFFEGPEDAPTIRQGIIKDLKFKAEDYTIEPSTRDFFYLTWRASSPS